MNILVISPAIYPCVIGGVEIFNYYLIKGLVKKGNKIWVITNCSYDWNHRNIHLVKVNERFLLNPTLSTLFHLFLELITLKRKIDVIHVPYTSNSILAYPILFARKFLNIQYIIIIHGGGMRPWKPKILHKIFFMCANTIVAV
ncbi:MAG: glycosyltransferase, partial [Candidatus Hermodarchaeota archaeon]